MADTMAADTSEPDIWARHFKIASLKTDPVRWDEDWERALLSLSSGRVYVTLGGMLKKSGIDPEKLSQLTQGTKNDLCKAQKAVVELWDHLRAEGHFKMAWLLLDERERRRHLLKGLEQACEHGVWDQDSRSLCPEIIVSSMLKLKGRVFLDLIRNYTNGKQGVGEGSYYCLPSEWWDKAVGEVPGPALEELLESTFMVRTLHRNEFITNFLLQAVMSLMNDLGRGSPGIDPVVHIMKKNLLFASWDITASGILDEPIIRCENCTKNHEEIGVEAKFMLCSSCKSKLDFTVHYCSQACQKEDWRKHKRHCGKTRVSKELRGTIHDPFRAFPIRPDYIIPTLPPSHDGKTSISATGFPSSELARSYSPALQRQVSLLVNDKSTDYFLFDKLDEPVPVKLPDANLRLVFRDSRIDAWSTVSRNGMEIMAQYLIQFMGQTPGMSRERILRQFDTEYGEDATRKVEAFVKRGVVKGYGTDTFLEIVSRNLSAAAPMMDFLRA